MAHWPTCFWQTKTTTYNFKLGRFATTTSAAAAAFHLTHSGRANGRIRLKANHNDRSARGEMHSPPSKANTLAHKSIEATMEKESRELGVGESHQVAASSGLRPLLGQSARERELPKKQSGSMRLPWHDLLNVRTAYLAPTVYGDSNSNSSSSWSTNSIITTRTANQVASMPINYLQAKCLWQCATGAGSWELRAGPTTGPKRAAQSSKFRVPRPCLHRTRSCSRSLCLALAINCDFCWLFGWPLKLIRILERKRDRGRMSWL